MSVTLSIVDSLPTGSSVTFDPNPVTFSTDESGSKTSTLEITTSPSGSTGTFNFFDRGKKTGTGDKADSNNTSLIVQPSLSVTFGATAIEDVDGATEVLTVTIGGGLPISVTKAELPKTFAGIVKDSEGNPLSGVNVKIYGPNCKLLANLLTDSDGWYFFNYKHTGKAATYTITCNGITKTVTLKANQLALVNFDL